MDKHSEWGRLQFKTVEGYCCEENDAEQGGYFWRNSHCYSNSSYNTTDKKINIKCKIKNKNTK